jgi:hypothetical protein
MGMILTCNDPERREQEVLIKTKHFSIQAEVNEVNIIVGFNVTTGKKKHYIPVERQEYMKAFTKVYNLIKIYL